VITLCNECFQALTISASFLEMAIGSLPDVSDVASLAAAASSSDPRLALAELCNERNVRFRGAAVAQR
jgi:hypothetical protein